MMPEPPGDGFSMRRPGRTRGEAGESDAGSCRATRGGIGEMGEPGAGGEELPAAKRVNRVSRAELPAAKRVNRWLARAELPAAGGVPHRQKNKESS
jgi:hypothetical protein